MARTVSHFSLQRIAGTELRVVADVEEGVLQVVQVEEAVIRGYACRNELEPSPRWPHRFVTLLVLQDLQPLVRQLTPSPSRQPSRGGDEHEEAQLPPGGGAALNQRPVVNVYDLADPAGCHIFVNRQVMAKAGYWDDPLAIQGLLAHEHAHPLAESETTRLSRQLRVELTLADQGWQKAKPGQWPSAESGQPSTIGTQEKVHSLLSLLADKLCLYAPREVLANEMAIRRGFGQALLHLDQRTVAQAAGSVAGREDLRQQLQQEAAKGSLTSQGAGLLLLIADLKGYLDLALEVAAFYRTGMESEARELEGVLERRVFPYLEPEVARAYAALREQYRTLRADLTAPELIAWGEGVLSILTEVLVEKGLALRYRLQVEKSDG